ncbi:MAG: flagellar basal body P-ring formation chaperone FlgA, partial [Notoacmeibacter sp.]
VFGTPAKADPYAAVPVPLETIYAGETLSANQIGQRRYRKDWLARNQFAEVRTQVEGQTVRRTLVKGRPIALADLGPAKLVEEGEMVTAIFAGGALQIAAQMLALDAGSDGSNVRLRNPETGAIVQGRVAGFARVKVGP